MRPEIQELLVQLTQDLNAWASVFLVPNERGDALVCAAHYNLPADWAVLRNELSSGSMNARAFSSHTEVVANNIEEYLPPTTVKVNPHKMTASAVVLVGSFGTLEVLADTDGYLFDDDKLEAIRNVAQKIEEILSQ